MGAIVFAVVLLLWVWAEAAWAVLGRGLPAASPGRLGAYFLLALGVGLLLLLALLQWRLASSVLSAGWTREQFADFWSWLLTCLLPVVAWLGWRHAGAVWWRQQAADRMPHKSAAGARARKK